MRRLELRIPPLAVVVLAALLMWLIAAFTPGVRLYIPGQTAVASVVAGCGLLICVIGILQFRRAGTTVNPLRPEAASGLVTRGIYRFTRNPMYVGFALVLLAWAVFLQNPLNIIVLVAFVVYIDRFQVRPEERALKSKFGAQFDTYKRKVRRWL